MGLELRLRTQNLVRIIGTIGEVDSYRLPDAKGFASMQRYLIGDTDENRQRMREEILATSVKDLRHFADAMDEVAVHGRVVARPRIAAYLGSNRRIAFNEHGIFRHYPELDSEA